ncbi:MAG: Glutathione-regulated potassium-efflux system protein KefC [Accumulibacter sp.]|uniref:cation:proton antiporter domain-containing protein n=1 Tax=Accumulibacter sp. TaxID=2053492 RepID=UPI00121217EB|nr:cation:proton antiporter [Accumulibacter sp.]QKS30817.1 MAG: cation:proton antiporter [Candidatus Accumulibacter similis]TLD45314.1 MAG: Glutathione-regulated potassium-efflux system protein KefC [Accumulibacter sp.]
MDPKSFVYSAVLLLVVASIAVAVFRHFGLGSILGLLVTGVIVGPHTPGPFVTTEVEDVRHFTELGVVLLLFLIGLEMKPRRLWDLRRTLFGLGSLQIVVSALVIAAYFSQFMASWSVALLLGASFALSSTAFVIQMLRDQGELASRHGQTAFAILLMQDLAVVPLLAVVPVLADTGPLPGEMALWKQLAVAVTMVALVITAGRYLVPRLLDRLARQNNREAFFLAAMAAVFAAAMAMDRAGMSMALGAFLMGMMLSTSRYSLQIEATLEPHKGLLMSLFFVAVGMSVDLAALAQHPFTFALHVLAIVSLKVVVLYGLCRMFGNGRGTAVRVAFMLAQGGEFGFVVFGAAKALGVIDDLVFVMAVAVISLTMLLTPVLVKIGNRLAQRMDDRSLAVDQQPDYPTGGDESPPRVVIAGYGRVGHTVGTIMSSLGIPFLAFDADAVLVAKWRSEGHPVFYGDIGNPELLANASLQLVELFVLTIDDQHTALRAATLIRVHAPATKIVARARDLSTCDALLQAGVTLAFPETLEASLRLAAESLEALGISSDETGMLLRGVRSTDYALVRAGPEAAPQPKPPTAD